MAMNASFVSDGWDRLMDATSQARIACRTEVMAELRQRHRAQLERAGWFRRSILTCQIRREAEAIVHARLGLPLRGALFFTGAPRQD